MPIVSNVFWKNLLIQFHYALLIIAASVWGDTMQVEFDYDAHCDVCGQQW